ncbi:4-hydroxy-tetrahydrodipicolinate reductase [Woodsholea maritima]|uniref:4-hydroxy-tetrahydrodipicolinate reductase n=1 Tax=Woodsholea maritima TaxID=240237 RepID=UPI00035D71A4|nr:4-hydroxy-tetrahydrodipicolinate reductase [Woodsholea maritima]
MGREPLKIAIVGIAGRLGRSILHTAAARDDIDIVGAMVSHDSPFKDADIGLIDKEDPMGVTACVSLEEACATADIVIDTSVPKVTAAIAPRLADFGRPIALVTGVTGLSKDEHSAVIAAAQHIPVLQARNFSLGLTVVEAALKQLAASLSAKTWDAEIIEAHHKRKTDSPSGTALLLGEAIARARGHKHSEVAVFDRPRQGEAREEGSIGYSAVRGGGIIGEHTVRFLSELEEVELRHVARDRAIFAHGALDGAKWLATQPAGHYSMTDMAKTL